MREFHAGKPMLTCMLERLTSSPGLRDESIIVATSKDQGDDPIAQLVGASNDVEIYRGSESDVLGRYYDAANFWGCLCEKYMLKWRKFETKTVVRLTSDCPLVDPLEVRRLIDEFEGGGYDYLSNCHPKRYVVHGFDVEVFSYEALSYAHFNARERPEREHVTPYFYSQTSNIRAHSTSPGRDSEWQNFVDLGAATCRCEEPHPNFSVDTQADFDFVRGVFGKAYEKNPAFSMKDILEVLKS